MNTYSVKETAKLLGIKERAVQTRCKKENVRKKDNRYLITDEIIAEWRQSNAIANAKRNAKTQNANAILNAAQIDLQIQSLQLEIESLKAELSQYEIAENETIQVFTFDEYNLFEQRLQEWQQQRTELEHQEQLFAAEKKSVNELYEHYKEQFYYQRKQNEKVLEMHQKLIDVIGEQTKISIQRNIIEASDKEVIKKDTWKKP